MSLEYRCNILHKISAKDYTVTKWDLPQQGKVWFNIQNSIHIPHHSKRMKEKNIILSVTEKALDEMQHLFIIKTLNKLGREEGNCLNIMKVIHI